MLADLSTLICIRYMDCIRNQHLLLFRGNSFVTILECPFSIIFVIPGSIRKRDVVILPNLNPCSIRKFFRFRVFSNFVIATHSLNPSSHHCR